MKQTKQHKDLNILQHGVAVWNKTKQLIIGNFEGFKLPQWCLDNHHFIINNIEDWNTIQCYNVWHDCGKPFCKFEDESGKQHFPNHANKSKEIFDSTFPNNEKIAQLIELDMIMHTEKYEAIMSRNLPIKTLFTLLITAFAEIHANADMFGGIESTSFKIKYKQLDKLGKKLIELLPVHEDKYLYVFVRKDLVSHSHTVVQAGHAVFEYAKDHDGKHPSFVVLGVEAETDFKLIMSYLMDNNIQFKIFREPMEPYQNSITAICTEPLDLEKKKLLKDFKLLRI